MCAYINLAFQTLIFPRDITCARFTHMYVHTLTHTILMHKMYPFLIFFFNISACPGQNLINLLLFMNTNLWSHCTADITENIIYM